MTIRMVHPEHGAMHAYDLGDVGRLEKIGWSVEVVAEISTTLTPVEIQPEPQPIPPAIGSQERKKPGPKPKAK